MRCSPSRCAAGSSGQGIHLGPLRSLYSSLKLSLCRLVLLNLTLCLRYGLSSFRMTFRMALSVDDLDLRILGRGCHMYWFPLWCPGHGSTRRPPHPRFSCFQAFRFSSRIPRAVSPDGERRPTCTQTPRTLSTGPRARQMEAPSSFPGLQVLWFPPVPCTVIPQMGRGSPIAPRIQQPLVVSPQPTCLQQADGSRALTFLSRCRTPLPKRPTAQGSRDGSPQRPPKAPLQGG